MTTPRSPEPQDPRPLSDREQRALSELEQRLVDDDPRLGLDMRRSPRTLPISNRTFNTIVQLAVVLVVLVVLLPAPWAAALIAITFMAVPAGLAVIAVRGEQRGEQAGR